MGYMDTSPATPSLWIKIILGAVLSTCFYALEFWPGKAPSVPPHPHYLVFTGSGEPITPLPLAPPDLDHKKVALGRKLFNEPKLSHDNTIACASCHQLNHGGVDSRKYSLGIYGQSGNINAPTVYNSGYNFRQFWNGRAATLEQQVDGPVNNPVEMGSSWSEVISKLQKGPAYSIQFSGSYPDGITVGNIENAIATFERSLITPNSRFDKFLKGDSAALTSKEFSGYQLFKSYGCISCHQGINIGGNLYEKLGIMRPYFVENGHLTEADMGRYAITRNLEDMNVFKVPSLRNVALTAPYLHDGSAPTLEDAVKIMGKYQLGLDLTTEDISEIVAFLKTLTGEYNGNPL